LDERGMAIQTMRSTTHVQPGQTLSCAGCHESRHQAPAPRPVQAATREPSRITVGPEGSWPFRFDQLIQPVLNAKCVGCHNPKGRNEHAAKFNLTAEAAYDSLVKYGKPSLHDHIWERYRKGSSTQGACTAKRSALLAKLTDPKGDHKGRIDADAMERFITWMDTYAQRLGSFSDEQERDLLEFRDRSRDVLIERTPKKVASAE
jgi:hydrazine synthase alpha subunit-like protein